MSAGVKRGYGSMLVLLLLGALAIYGGTEWLVVLIPAAILVRHVAAPTGN